MPEEQATQLMMRLSLASVAVWWAVFSIPIFRKVAEPAAMAEETELGQSGVIVSLKRLGKTFRDIRDYKDLFWFLLTFMVYSNGIGTIITMAAAFATDLGFSTMTVLGTFLMVRLLPPVCAALRQTRYHSRQQKSDHDQPDHLHHRGSGGLLHEQRLAYVPAGLWRCHGAGWQPGFEPLANG